MYIPHHMSSLIEEICKRDDPTLLDSFPPILQWHTYLPWVRKYRALRVLAQMGPRVNSYLEANWDDIFLDADAVQCLEDIIDAHCCPISVLQQNNNVLQRHWLTDAVGEATAKAIIGMSKMTDKDKVDYHEEEYFRMMGRSNPSMALEAVRLLHTVVLHPRADSHAACFDLAMYSLEGLIEGGHIGYMGATITLLIEISGVSYGRIHIPWDALAKNFNTDMITNVIKLIKANCIPRDILLDSFGAIDYIKRLKEAEWLIDNFGECFLSVGIPFRLLGEDWEWSKTRLLPKLTCVDYARVSLVDKCVAAGVMSITTTPDITINHNHRPLIVDAIKNGYMDLCAYLLTIGQKLPAVVSYGVTSNPKQYNMLLNNGIFEDGIMHNACIQKNIHHEWAHITNRTILKVLLSKAYELSTTEFIEMVGCVYFIRDGYYCDTEVKRYNPRTEKQFLSIIWSICIFLPISTEYSDLRYFIASTSMRRYMQRRFGGYIHSSSRPSF